MTETPRTGDRVRVTPKPFDGEMVCDGSQGRLIQVRDEQGRVNAFGPDYATVEVLERADDPTIGEIRAVAPSLDGKAKTAVKVGARLSDTPGERCLWVIVETGEVLKDGDVTGLGEVIGTVRPDSSRPSVRVPNEPFGPSPEVRQRVAELVLAGDVLAAVNAVKAATHWLLDDAHQYVREMSEYQTYLEQQARKSTDRDLCTKDECPGGTRCSSGATVWHDRTPECGDAS